MQLSEDKLNLPCRLVINKCQLPGHLASRMTPASKPFRDAFKTKARDTCEGDFSIQSMSDIAQVVSGPHAESPKGPTKNPWLQWDSTGSCSLWTGNHWKTAGCQPLWVDCTWGFFNFWAQIKPFDLWTWDFGQKIFQLSFEASEIVTGMNRSKPKIRVHNMTLWGGSTFAATEWWSCKLLTFGASETWRTLDVWWCMRKKSFAKQMYKIFLIYKLTTLLKESQISYPCDS